MDKERIEGIAHQAQGKVKAAAGKLIGDAKLEAEGIALEAQGKIENAAGGVRDAVKPDQT